MFKPTTAYSGFSVRDVAKTKAFYGDVLGLQIEEGSMGLELHLPGNTSVFVYQKDNHEPASFTILNFVVEDIDQALAALEAKGVEFIQYQNTEFPQDEKGVARGMAGIGPNIAWFEDPSGNVLSILQELR